MSIINHNGPLSVQAITKFYSKQNKNKKKGELLLLINIDHMDIAHNHLDHGFF
jgi:hypothetical protein